MSDSETCSNQLQLDLMLILDNFVSELNSPIIIWPFRLYITFGWLQKLNPGYEICIISYQVNLSSEVSAMFNSLMPSLNSRSLPFVVFLGGFPSRCQNLSSGAIRPGGLLLWLWLYLQKAMYHPCDIDLWPMKVKLFWWIDYDPISVLSCPYQKVI